MSKTLGNPPRKIPFLTIIFIAIFIVVFGTAFLLAYNGYKTEIKSTKASLRQTANLISDIILANQRTALVALDSCKKRLSFATAVKNRDRNVVLRHLKDLKAAHPEIDSIIVAGENGILWENFPVNKIAYGRNCSENEWYRGVSKNWKPYVSGLFRRQLGDLCAFVCAPIFDEKERVIGIIGTPQPSILLGGIIRKIDLRSDLRMSLLDQNGMVIYSNRFSESSFRDKLLEFPSFSSVRKNSEGLKVIEIKDPSDENRLKYVASAPVGEIGWSVIVERGRQEVLKAQFGFFIHIGVIALLTYSLFIFLFIYRRKRHDYLAQLRFLASELLEVQEKEKKRIAGELHDGIGQVLNFAGVAVKKALKKMPGEKALEAALGMIDTGIRDLRKLHQDLRPSLLDHAGLLTTIEWFCREYKSIYPGVQIKQQLDVSEEEIPEPLKIRIFRVVQEAMNNAAKHSNADSIIVSLKVADQRLELKIEDNGKGIDLESASQIGKGLGLISMKERVLLSGGEFKIRSERGKGTVILCLWPKHLSSNNLISAGP